MQANAPHNFLYVYFPVLFCLSVSVKWLAVKTASEMTYCVSGGALNSTHSLTHIIFYIFFLFMQIKNDDDYDCDDDGGDGGDGDGYDDDDAYATRLFVVLVFSYYNKKALRELKPPRIKPSLYHNCDSTTIGYNYDTTIPRRTRLRRKWSKLRFDCDTTTTKNWHVHFLLASNWKHARAIRRSRIVVVS